MNANSRQIPLIWSVGNHTTRDSSPLQNVPATVPGAVQLDWARAKNWPEHWKADHFLKYHWMEDFFWTYSARLEIPAIEPGETVHFVCGGIDYRFQIWLNDHLLLEQEGMFTPVRINLDSTAKPGDEIRITIWPPPKQPSSQPDRWQANQTCKPPVSYGWDWHPRLIPSGIWKDAYLEIRPAFHIRGVQVHSTFDSEMVEARLEVQTELSIPGRGQLRITLLDPDGAELFTNSLGFDESALGDNQLSWSKSVAFPRLWWPNGHGDQPLYTLRVRLIGQAGEEMDTFERRIGLRRIRLVMHEGAWELPSTGGLPASRRNPPITLEVNGRKIFAKGTNWVPPDIFPGNITAELYFSLLRTARNAHFNLIRCWGGGIVNKPEFYDICDQLGLMVWTEFPLACLSYETEPGSNYLRVLDQESRSIIRQIRGHACHALWCGGNELFNSWSMMTDQSPALRLLNRNCFDLDPSTPFLPTSPLMGMAHGDYRFRNTEGEEVFQIYFRQAGLKTAYAEFGVPGASPVEYLKTFIPETELFPPAPKTSWEWHHAFAAWAADAQSWLMVDTLEHYFGKAPSLETLVEQSTLLQCQGYKCIYEEARRQKPVVSMALNWCYNEPWPSAANNSLINWPDKPKTAYFAVAASCRPVIASARVPQFSWKPGEVFSAELWILNDSPEPVPPGRFEAELDFGSRVISLGNWDHPGTLPNVNLQGPRAEVPLPPDLPARFKLRVRLVDHPGWDSEYVFLRAISP
jgi:beta-mannosidase